MVSNGFIWIKNVDLRPDILPPNPGDVIPAYIVGVGTETAGVSFLPDDTI